METATARRTPWAAIYVVIAVLLLAILGFLFLTAPRKDGALMWDAPMIKSGWMAWTLATALFFFCIGSLLTVMTLITARFPETPRVGILRIETTRGDRLFISLLGSAFICLAWLGLVSENLWWALVVCLIYATAVFRWV